VNLENKNNLKSTTSQIKIETKKGDFKIFKRLTIILKDKETHVFLI
jgi:hypothetical protein